MLQVNTAKEARESLKRQSVKWKDKKKKNSD